MKSIKLPLGSLSALAVLMISIMMAMPASADAAIPSVAVTNIQVSPAALMPGDTGIVTVTITNTPTSLSGSTSTSSDTYNYGAGVSNGLTTPAHTSVSSTVNTNAPDSAYVLKQVQLLADSPIYVTSGDYNDIGSLGLSDSATFIFTIRADNSSVDGIYRMTLKVRTDNDAVYLNYPIKVQVESDQPQIVISHYAKGYNGTDNGMSVDVFNPRDTAIQAVSIRSSGDDFVIEPQNAFVGTLAPSGTYSADFTVKSIDNKYDSLPRFVLVYKNGDNWHQTTAITAATLPVDADWWTSTSQGLADTWWPYFAAGLVVAIIVLGVGTIVFRRSKAS